MIIKDINKNILNIKFQCCLVNFIGAAAPNHRFFHSSIVLNADNNNNNNNNINNLDAPQGNDLNPVILDENDIDKIEAVEVISDNLRNSIKDFKNEISQIRDEECNELINGMSSFFEAFPNYYDKSSNS